MTVCLLINFYLVPTYKNKTINTDPYVLMKVTHTFPFSLRRPMFDQVRVKGLRCRNPLFEERVHGCLHYRPSCMREEKQEEREGREAGFPSQVENGNDKETWKNFTRKRTRQGKKRRRNNNQKNGVDKQRLGEGHVIKGP